MSQPERSESLVERFRAAMPIAGHYAYFDHAAVAPLPEPTRRAIAEWLDEAAEHGDTRWLRWAERLKTLRSQAAAMIGAGADEIALVPNTTAGLSIVAEGWPWQAGDNVVTLANEFPSNLYPWMNLASRGVETRLAQVEGGVVDLQRVEEQIDGRTRLLSVSWVGYASGYRLDLAEVVSLCRRRGVRLVVDAIQGLGVFPIDVEALGIDFLAADGHKWLLGPEGAGLLYVRREHLDRLRPIGVGWNSVEAGSDYGRIEFKLRDSAARWEGGSQNMVGMIGLQASVELLQQLGVGPAASPVAEQILTFTDEACARLEQVGATILSPRQGEHRSGIVTFLPPGGMAPKEVRARLMSAGVVVSCRGGGIRIAPHAYNDGADLERLVSGLLECKR